MVKWFNKLCILKGVHMSKLKVKIIDSHTLMLEENGQVGDTIDLKSLHSVDESFIMERIKSQQDETYNRLLEGVLKENQSQIQLKLNEQLRNFELEKNKLIQDKLNLEGRLSSQVELSKKNEQILTNTLKSEFELERQRLNNEIQTIELKIKQNLENTYKEQINQKASLIQSLQAEKEKMIIEHQLQLNQKIAKLNDDISIKEKEIEALKRERSSRNIKTIGENLEIWCDEQFKNVSLYGFKTSTFTKDNLVIKTEGDSKGTKGDYIFKVFNNESHDILLTSAMIEMKSEALESENKKKNSDHYKKLDDDRNKKNLEYAILVSELEYNYESDAPIFSVPGYEKMYVVRPHFFITLLGILESIGMKYADIITNKEIQKIEFQESEKILQDFEKFKEDIIGNSIRHITTQLENIKTKTNTIISSVEAIQESVRVILDSHLNAVRNKIEGYSIRRVVKHIEKIQD